MHASIYNIQSTQGAAYRTGRQACFGLTADNLNRRIQIWAQIRPISCKQFFLENIETKMFFWENIQTANDYIYFYENIETIFFSQKYTLKAVNAVHQNPITIIIPPLSFSVANSQRSPNRNYVMLHCMV